MNKNKQQSLHPSSSSTSRAGPPSEVVYNVAFQKEVTCSFPDAENLSYVTDGIKDTFAYANDGSPTPNQYFQIDLGQQFRIDTVVLWRYFDDHRTYVDTIVQISTDPTFQTNVTTVYNNDFDGSSGNKAGTNLVYRERSSGKRMDFSPTEARYVRIYSSGSEINPFNHIVEVEVWTALDMGNNLAFQKKYTLSKEPSPVFPDTGSRSTDGVLAKEFSAAYAFVVPAEGISVDAVLDLETLQKINFVRYHPYEGFFYQPDTISVFTSVDGNDWVSQGDLSSGVGFRWREIRFSDTSARYVKFTIAKTFDQWGDDWMFVDEFQIYGPDSDPPYNVAFGKRYISTVDASATYPDTGKKELTDGIYATGNHTDPAWQGRNQPVYSHTVDLGVGNFSIQEFSANFYQDTGRNIYWPDTVSFAVSPDGIGFTQVGNAVSNPPHGFQNRYKTFVLEAPATLPTDTRYVKMTITNSHPWTFTDEMAVQARTDVALGKSYTSSIAAHEGYPDRGGVALTDGKYAVGNFTASQWQGRWNAPDYNQTIDLGRTFPVSEIFTNFCRQEDAGIFWPTEVVFSYSIDGTNFTSLGASVPQPAHGLNDQSKKYLTIASPPVDAQYVKMSVIPGGEWTFTDETEVISTVDVALDRPYITEVPAHPAYPDTENKELTDEVFGSESITDPAWQGRRFQNDYYQVIDLGSNQYINKMSSNFLQQTQFNVFWPSSVTYAYSIDGINFIDLGFGVGEQHGPTGKLKRFTKTLVNPVTARYVRSKVKNTKEWTFEDEIQVFNAVRPLPTYGNAPSSADILNIIPYPSFVVPIPGVFTLSSSSRIIYNQQDLAPLAAVLRDEIAKVCGLTLLAVLGEEEAPGDISLFNNGLPSGDELHSVIIEEVAKISGYDYNTISMGTVTLIQILKPDGTIKKVEIHDRPAMGYRSAMIDVARQRHNISTLIQAVLVCRLYKIRYLHLHLNDHNAWTFPSTTYKELGSHNWGAHGGVAPVVYNIDELKELVKFAEARGVIIVPEINTPGHCATLAGDRPDIFGGYNAQGQPVTSGYTNMVSETTYEAMAIIYRELTEVFTSTPYIVIGGDEASFGGIETVTTYESFIQSKGLSGVDELYAYWMDRMRQYVENLGGTAVAWEGYYTRQSAQKLIGKSLVLINWHGQNYDAPSMVADGFRVINSPWRATNNYEWSVYSFNSSEHANPELYNYELAPTDRVLGSVAPYWEFPEIASTPLIRLGTPPRLERTWSPDGTRGYYDFYLRYRQTDRLLDVLLA